MIKNNAKKLVAQLTFYQIKKNQKIFELNEQKLKN